METPIMTLKEAAEFLKVPLSTLTKYCGKQDFPAVKVGDEWRVHKVLLEVWFFPKLQFLLSKNRPPIDAPPHSKRHLSSKDAADFLGLPERAIQKVVYPHNPALKVDSMGRMLKKDLELWAKQNKEELEGMQQKYYKDAWMRRNVWYKAPPER